MKNEGKDSSKIWINGVSKYLVHGLFSQNFHFLGFKEKIDFSRYFDKIGGSQCVSQIYNVQQLNYRKWDARRWQIFILIFWFFDSH